MIRAIDISHWEGTYATNTPPNWAGAALDNVQIGITKVTERRNTDSMFEYNWLAMLRQGIRRGGFAFWWPTDGQYEADLFSRSITGTGKALEFAPVLDFEPSMVTFPSRIAGVDAKVKAWLDRVEQNTGMKPIIYTAPAVWNLQFPTPPTWIVDYKLWIANYPNDISTVKNQWDLSGYAYQKPKLPVGWTYDQVMMWQFTTTGVIPGFGGGVDLNYYYENGFNGG